MTENEAIKNFQQELKEPLSPFSITMCNMAIKALEEIQQYRAIGTVKGFERAIESSIENYNLYREYKAKVQEFETIGTIEEFKALKEKKHIGSGNMVISSSDLMTILNNDSEENKEGYKHGYSDGYAKGIDDLVNGLLNWKSQDEEYKSFSDMCNEIKERLKGADMITPIRTMTINQIAERKDDLLMPDADIREIARNVRNKALDEFAERLKGKAEEILKNPDIVAECKKCTIWTVKDIDEIAEQLKKGWD